MFCSILLFVLEKCVRAAADCLCISGFSASLDPAGRFQSPDFLCQPYLQTLANSPLRQDKILADNREGGKAERYRHPGQMMIMMMMNKAQYTPTRLNLTVESRRAASAVC